jgi:hypothetical protein
MKFKNIRVNETLIVKKSGKTAKVLEKDRLNKKIKVLVNDIEEVLNPQDLQEQQFSTGEYAADRLRHYI